MLAVCSTARFTGAAKPRQGENECWLLLALLTSRDIFTNRIPFEVFSSSFSMKPRVRYAETALGEEFTVISVSFGSLAIHSCIALFNSSLPIPLR
jgi:hypothetical protein